MAGQLEPLEQPRALADGAARSQNISRETGWTAVGARARGREQAGHRGVRPAQTCEGQAAEIGRDRDAHLEAVGD